MTGMERGWTGGQWSMVRAMCAAFLLVWATEAVGAAASTAAAAGATIALAAAVCLGVGLRTRGAAIVLLLCLVAVGGGAPTLRSYAAAWLLTVVAVTGVPYGAWDGRGRDDPAGDWRMPAWLATAMWSLFAFHHAARGLESLQRGTTLAALVDLDLALFAIVPSLRAMVWATAAGVELGRIAVAGGAGIDGATWFVQVLALQPCWFPPRPVATLSWLFYDGGCALCHAAVRFVLAEDAEPALFRMAPLGGANFCEKIPQDRRDRLPDSIVVVGEGGGILVRSAAVLFVLDRVGGLWRPLAALARAVPSRWRDALYDALAARRYRWFGRKADACPVLDPELKARLDA